MLTHGSTVRFYGRQGGPTEIMCTGNLSGNGALQVQAPFNLPWGSPGVMSFTGVLLRVALCIWESNAWLCLPRLRT